MNDKIKELMRELTGFGTGLDDPPDIFIATLDLALNAVKLLKLKSELLDNEDE